MRWKMVVIGAMVVACSDKDKPMDPDPGPQTFNYPGAAATLAEVVALTSDGDVIEIGAGAHEVPLGILVETAITIRGRSEGSTDPRPSLVFQDSTDDGIQFREDGCEVRGLRLAGSFTNGLFFNDVLGDVFDCRIEDARRDAISYFGAGAGGMVELNILVGTSRFGINATRGAEPTATRNTIVDTGDCGLYSTGSSPIYEKNIVADSANFGIACFGSSLPTLGCNVLFNNATADYSESCPEAPSDLLMDPMFCDTDAYTLNSMSPAVDADGCGGIGAVETTCEP